MTEDTPHYRRIALADDLHLTWDRHALTLATTRWDPGTFVYDIEYLTIEALPSRGGMKVVLGSRGAHHRFAVLRFELDDPAFRRFEAFLAPVIAYRDRLRTSLA
ncbi:hypothetical protein [Microbacterium sp. No. 7]|uniref:hypothetical protein n=1 Tax=Microbacterium sp. No. 7 TaxID=1714373 RepID=UPI0006D04C77|nr:hypothetical protein [Microbacterium sp. No. 7]ALJ20090.1 hypothetical protein AOA12_09275 [Microbacterium sp. No. 7]